MHNIQMQTDPLLMMKSLWAWNSCFYYSRPQKDKTVYILLCSCYQPNHMCSPFCANDKFISRSKQNFIEKRHTGVWAFLCSVLSSWQAAILSPMVENNIGIWYYFNFSHSDTLKYEYFVGLCFSVLALSYEFNRPLGLVVCE